MAENDRINISLIKERELKRVLEETIMNKTLKIKNQASEMKKLNTKITQMKNKSDSDIETLTSHYQKILLDSELEFSKLQNSISQDHDQKYSADSQANKTPHLITSFQNNSPGNNEEISGENRKLFKIEIMQFQKQLNIAT